MARLIPIYVVAAITLSGVYACSSDTNPESTAAPSVNAAPAAATPKAVCGPGSQPETGIQGRVSATDQASGLTAKGITCNTELVGSYTVPNAIGTVGGFKVERYTDKAGHDCAYYDTTAVFPTNILDQTAGVNVLDMSDPTKPTLTASLTTPAMLSPHESLVVSQQRGVLAAVLGNPAFGPGVVDVYDIAADCRHPALKSSAPIGVLGHESGISPDGKTFYSASPGTPTIVAISCDVPDTTKDRGLIILDISDVQARKPLPQAREIARLTWPAMTIPQNAIPFTQKGHPYLLEIDEFARGGVVGAARIIDIGDEKTPKVISDLRLEVHNPENFAAIANDPAASSIAQGYAGHYCNVPTRVDPTIVACSMILSGLRVFDIRDPFHPREIAYFNAPQYPRMTPVLVQSNYAMASPSFVPERKEIWYSDVYSGFYAVRVTNGAWPSN
jgi:hypothetical protein